MRTSNTTVPVYSFDFDFNDLQATCDYNIKGIDIVISFTFDFEITNVIFSKEDYFVPDTWLYDFDYDIYIEDSYYFLDNKAYKVTEHHRQIIKNLIESDIKNYIDENELYKD